MEHMIRRTMLTLERFRLCVAGLLAILLVSSALPVVRGTDASLPSGPISTIYFLPLGGFPLSLTTGLVEYYRQKFGLVIETLPAIPYKRAVVDYRRQQLIAEEVRDLVWQRYPELAQDPTVLIIALTSEDIYIRSLTWRFAFAYRNKGQFAVVSSYRMDPEHFGQPPDPELMGFRLRKMVSKQIGILYFRLPQSNDRNSVMFGPILGLRDLDDMGEEYQETDIPFAG